MQLHELIKIKTRSQKRVGRGTGSGKGKTGGRGTKGQKARGKVPAGFIGGTLPIYKKLPFRRGLGNPKRAAKITPIPLSKLANLPAGSLVDMQSLINSKIITAKDAAKKGVKVVGNGELNIPLEIRLPISASAAKKVEKAGGKVANG